MVNFRTGLKARAAGAALLGCFATVALTPAQAADLGGSIKDDPVYVDAPRLHRWTGFYMGLHAGAAWDDRSVALSAATPGAQVYFDGGAVPTSISNDEARFLGGAQAGYNWQSGTMVLGLEIDYSALAGDGEVGVVNTSAGGFSDFRTRVASKVDQLATLRARLGFTVTPSTLLYVTGGLAVGNTSLSSSIVTPTTSCTGAGLCAVGASSGWQAGWTAGAGIEHALSQRWTLKAEYLHYDLGSDSVRTNDPLFPARVFESKAKFEGDIVRAGFNYRF